MTAKQELYTILNAYLNLQEEIAALPDRSERHELTDEEYDALSEKHDEEIKKTERHVFELLNSSLSRAEEDPNFWKFANRGLV